MDVLFLILKSYSKGYVVRKEKIPESNTVELVDVSTV